MVLGGCVMNVRIAAALLAGGAITAAIGLALGFGPPLANAQDGGGPELPPSTDLETTLSDLSDSLELVRSQISDPDIAAYYDKLVASYALEEAQAEDSPLPDMVGIQHAALTLPFIEAGKNIRDDDIRDFYLRFISDAGLTIPAPARESP
jgi:hypothetical protein